MATQRRRRRLCKARRSPATEWLTRIAMPRPAGYTLGDPTVTILSGPTPDAPTTCEGANDGAPARRGVLAGVLCAGQQSMQAASPLLLAC